MNLSRYGIFLAMLLLSPALAADVTAAESSPYILLAAGEHPHDHEDHPHESHGDDHGHSHEASETDAYYGEDAEELETKESNTRSDKGPNPKEASANEPDPKEHSHSEQAPHSHDH